MLLSRSVLVGALSILFASGALSPASAAGLDDPVDQWLPSSPDATWTYNWVNSEYSPTATSETYTVASQTKRSFRLAWTGTHPEQTASTGQIDYQRTDAGLVVTNWSSTPPPTQFPILCPSASQCANSLAGVHYLLIWGNRSPALIEPLLRGTRWNSLGGGNNDVASASRYLGYELIRVPAFPEGVIASKVETNITQAGALGDPFGSGVRTVWWVRGVGPVHVEFRHAGGEVTLADLMSTNQKPLPAPSDDAYVPFRRGDVSRFRWRNTKHMKKWSRQRVSVAQVVNNTARVDVKSISGPIKLAGSYVFSTRLSGVTNLSAETKAATLSKFPPLGPGGRPQSERRHFFTPLDFMTYGFGPVVTAYPAVAQSWASSTGSRDYLVYGVTGTTRILGVADIRVPAGRYKTIVVRSDLKQLGYSYGSGRRTSWFAPGVGLVKLQFAHADGSVSIVERIKGK